MLLKTKKEIKFFAIWKKKKKRSTEARMISWCDAF